MARLTRSKTGLAGGRRIAGRVGAASAFDQFGELAADV